MDRRKRFFILLPGGHPHPLKIGPLRTSFREAPLTGTLLAALVPAELNFEVTYVDASVSPIPLEGDFDLVAISLITGMALRGYELAAHYRSRGATVVLGSKGVLPYQRQQYRIHRMLHPAGFRTWLSDKIR